MPSRATHRWNKPFSFTPIALFVAIFFLGAAVASAQGDRVNGGGIDGANGGGNNCNGAPACVCRNNGEACGGPPVGCCMNDVLTTWTPSCCNGLDCNGGTCAAAAQCGNGVVEGNEQCDGGACCNGSCQFTNANVCRAANGACDTEERCQGNSATCPADAFQGAGTACRAANGACDLAEACTGNSGACPADGFVGAGTECRAAAGGCDNAEACTGNAAACPQDAFKAEGTACRAIAGVCDVLERCSGSEAQCPQDAFKSNTAECRAKDGECDVAENCPGNSAACPANGFSAEGSQCGDQDCCRPGQCDGNSASCQDECVNGPPAIHAIPNQQAERFSNFTLGISASDPDGDTLQWSATGLPSNLSMSANGNISGMLAYMGSPPRRGFIASLWRLVASLLGGGSDYPIRLLAQAGSAGTHTVTVTANDQCGGTAQRTFTLTVTEASGGGSSQGGEQSSQGGQSSEGGQSSQGGQSSEGGQSSQGSGGSAASSQQSSLQSCTTPGYVCRGGGTSQQMCLQHGVTMESIFCADGSLAEFSGDGGPCQLASGEPYCGGRCGRCPLCGNGTIDVGETCDDKNSANGDCCSSSCQIEQGCQCFEAESGQPSGSGGGGGGNTSGGSQSSGGSGNGSQTCTDSDNGQNVLVQGTVTYPATGGFTDECFDQGVVASYVVRENTCWGGQALLGCPEEHECLNGACVPAPGQNIAIHCTDSDGGLVPGTAGIVQDEQAGTPYTRQDACFGIDGDLNEFYCSGQGAHTWNDGESESVLIHCPNGCSNGACL